MKKLLLLFLLIIGITQPGQAGFVGGFLSGDASLGGLNQPIYYYENTNFIFEGDSITGGLFCNPPNDYPTNLYNYLYQGSPVNSTKTNIGTSGISTLTMNTNYATRAGAGFSSTSVLNVLTYMAGTNTSGGSDTTALQKYSLIRSYLRKAQTTGYNRIVVGTLLARNDDGGTFTNGIGATLNTYIRTYYNSDLRADGLIDWGSDYRFSTPAATANTIYYNVDLLHPKGPPPYFLGCVSMASVALGPLSSVLTGPQAAYVQVPTFSVFDLSNITLSNSNRTATVTSGGGQYTVGGFPFVNSGKWYFEIAITSGGTQVSVGLVNESFTNFSAHSLGAGVNPSNSIGYYQTTGSIYLNNSIVATAATFTTGDVVEVVFDRPNQLVWFRRNRSGVKQNWNGNGSADPATGVGGISISALGTGYIHPAAGVQSTSDTVTSNFSAAQFADTPPTGFSAFAP